MASLESRTPAKDLLFYRDSTSNFRYDEFVSLSLSLSLKMISYALSSRLLIYAPLCHWVWGGGWIGAMGALDFAGGTAPSADAGTRGAAGARGAPPRPSDPGRWRVTENPIGYSLLQVFTWDSN